MSKTENFKKCDAKYADRTLKTPFVKGFFTIFVSEKTVCVNGISDISKKSIGLPFLGGVRFVIVY